jgi:hypothetical protein
MSSASPLLLQLTERQAVRHSPRGSPQVDSRPRNALSLLAVAALSLGPGGRSPRQPLTNAVQIVAQGTGALFMRVALLSW